MNFLCKSIIAFFILFCQTQARDPETIKKHSIERCGAMGIYEVDGENPSWCCNCPAGYFKVADCGYGSPTSTTCEMCPFDPNDSNNQTYTTGPNNLTVCKQSINEAQCDDIRNAHWEIGSITKPNSCVCDAGYFAKPDKLMEYGCNQHSPCEEGYEPVEVGTGTTNPLCRPCRPGMFSNASSSTEMCKFHSKCKEGEIMKSKGNATSDTHCVKPREIQKVKDGTFPLWILAVIVLTLVSLGAIVYGLYQVCNNGWPCRTTNEHVSSEEVASSSMNQQINEHINKCFHVSEASEDSSKSLIHNKDEANIDDKRSSVQIINETNQQTPLEKANTGASPTSRLDEVSIHDIKPAWSSSYLKAATPTPLGDENTRSKDIVYRWKNITFSNLRPTIRMFLTEVEIKDIEDNHKNDVLEIRHQWIYLICKKLGRTLTAEYLLNKDYSDKCFKDILLLDLAAKALDRLELKDPYCKTG